MVLDKGRAIHQGTYEVLVSFGVFTLCLCLPKTIGRDLVIKHQGARIIGLGSLRQVHTADVLRDNLRVR